MKSWKSAVLIGGLSVVAVLGAAALAFGADGPRHWAPFGGMSGGMMFAADGDDQAGQGGQGCGGSGLMQDSEARNEMWALRDEHRGEMRQWWETYGDDPSSVAAEKALQELKAEHAADMRALFEKYGVEPPPGLGQGGPGACGGQGGDPDGDGLPGSGCGGGSGQGLGGCDQGPSGGGCGQGDGGDSGSGQGTSFGGSL